MLFEDIIREPIRFEKPRMPQSIYKFGEEHQISKERMKSAFDGGELRPLGDNDWEHLQGTQSWHIKSLDDIKKTNTDFTREFNTLQKAMKYKNTVEAPTVIQVKNKKPILISDDVWLMCIRAMGVKPMVYWINIS